MRLATPLCLALSFVAAPAVAADLTHFESWTHNKIGEEVLNITVQDHGKEVFKLTLPSTQTDLTPWVTEGHLRLDWSHCRTPEMLAQAGELTQCIRRGFLSLKGEGDHLAPAVLDISLDKAGELQADYLPDMTIGAVPLHFTARAELATLTYWHPSRPRSEAMLLSRGAQGDQRTAQRGQVANQHHGDAIHAVAAAAATKFIFFGDAGTGDQHQYDVAAGLSSYCGHDRAACQFVLMLGDNFYTTGVSSSRDSQWESKFERPYSGLDLDFFPVLGNHDHYGDIQAQLDYAALSPHWKLPARYYSFEDGNVAFFGIDSDDFDLDQQRWLEARLAASTKPWKIVYGHHPVYSYGSHADTEDLKERLLPVLAAAGVDFYLCGHDHDKQIIERDGLNFIVTGTAGARIRPVDSGNGTVFALSSYGFSHLTIDGQTATLDILDQDGGVEFSRRYQKTQPGQPARPASGG